MSPVTSLISTFHWALPLAALALAFLLSLAVALVYIRLHKGMPNIRPFAQTLGVAGVVSAMIVLSIGDSIARGIGLVGALTVIRFRSDLKDPRDLIFAFAALATGVAAGAYAWAVALGGTAIFLAATAFVSRPWFAQGDSFEAVVSLRTSSDTSRQAAIARTLTHYCESFTLMRVRQLTAVVQEHAYQVRLKHQADRAALVEALKGVAHADDPLLVTLDSPRDMVTNR